MKYRDILGYSKSKKKVTKEQSKPKKTVLAGIKKDLLKESYVWERKFGEKLPTLADIQKKKLNEVGAGAEYRKYYKNIEKTENVQAKQVNNLVQLLMKKGLKKEATAIASKYVKGVAEFDNFLKKLIGKMM